MNDVIYIGFIVGFFVVAGLYAHFCATLVDGMEKIVVELIALSISRI
jgi:hypothetical protein